MKKVKANDRFLLVLTSTITPAPGVVLARMDPGVRRADYLQAFEFWLKHPDPRLQKILFIENSGADLCEFRKAARESGKDVEFISLPPNPPPAGMHYGYSELQMLDDALSASRLRKTTTHMIKATGRLVFPDLPKLLDRIPGNLKVAVDSRSRLPFRPSGNGFVSLQLFVVRHDVYDEKLRASYVSLTDEEHYPHVAEHLYFELLVEASREETSRDKEILLRFPVNCEPVGFAGHSGKRYDRPSGLFIAQARAMCRLVAPNFWL